MRAHSRRPAFAASPSFAQPVDVTDAHDHDADEEKHGDSLATGTADQFIKDAIPYLPLPAAFLLCFLNIIIPGLGWFKARHFHEIDVYMYSIAVTFEVLHFRHDTERDFGVRVRPTTHQQQGQRARVDLLRERVGGHLADVHGHLHVRRLVLERRVGRLHDHSRSSQHCRFCSNILPRINHAAGPKHR